MRGAQHSENPVPKGILAATRGETHPGKQQEPIKGAQCNLGDPFSEGKLEGETHLTPQLLTADHYCIRREKLTSRLTGRQYTLGQTSVHQHSLSRQPKGIGLALLQQAGKGCRGVCSCCGTGFLQPAGLKGAEAPRAITPPNPFGADFRSLPP